MCPTHLSFPDPTKIATIEEPYVKAQIMVPQEFVGAVMELAQRKRGDFVTMDYIDDNRVNVIYQIPLAEIVFDFFDKLKSSTRGYASFDYELSEYRPSKLVKWISFSMETRWMLSALSFTRTLPMNVETHR